MQVRIAIDVCVVTSALRDYMITRHVLCEQIHHIYTDKTRWLANASL